MGKMPIPQTLPEPFPTYADPYRIGPPNFAEWSALRAHHHHMMDLCRPYRLAYGTTSDYARDDASDVAVMAAAYYAGNSY